MPLVDVSLGQQVDAWLDRLDREGFRVGVRERLVIQTLLARLSADGKLFELQSSHEVLNIVGPLVCTKPEQQRKYAVLLKEFLAQPGGVSAQRHVGESDEGGRRKPWRWRWWQALLLLLVFGIVVVAITWQFGLLGKLVPPPIPPEPVPSPIVVPPEKEPASRIEKPIYVPMSSFPIPASITATESGWIAPLRMGLLGLGSLSGLSLAWLAWARWRRQLYLQAVRTDEAVTERFLRDPHPVVLEPSMAIVRGAARQLRQRYAGERETIDLPSTIRATMAAGGALTPRYRALSQTPEYLILIDQRHPADHHTAYSLALVEALKNAGVAVQVYYFEGSPQTGCWQVRQTARGQDRIRATTVSELSARLAGHRLLVFGDARALVEESDGEPRAWAKYLRLFPQRAWLTPMPLASWGSLEQLLDEQGFLLLPIQQESLTTMASWFSSGHLGLEVAEDWPLSFPPMLREQDVVWVSRQSAILAKDQEELLFQLRNYLGATRFQWLCACVLFPAVSPAITLALGRELVGEDMRELALGMAAIGALPWFRYAFMPVWLRQALTGCLIKANEARFRDVIERRLGDAVEDRDGASLLSIAEKKQLLTAWFRKRSGLARDVVLVDFLYRGPLAKLAQQLPEALRKRLFRSGLPAYGLTTGVLWLLPIGLLIGLLGVPGIWELLPTRSPEVASIIEQVGVLLEGHEGEVTSVAFSPDGARVLSGGADGSVRFWDARTNLPIGEPLVGHMSRVTSIAISSDGTKLLSAVGTLDGLVRLWNVQTREQIGDPLRGHGMGILGDGVTSVAFSPDGRTFLSGGNDGTLRIWNAETMKPIGEPLKHKGLLVLVAFSPDGTKFLSGSRVGTLQLWDAHIWKPIGEPLNQTAGVTSVAFSPDGTKFLSGGKDGMLRLWDAQTREQIGELLTGHEKGEFPNDESLVRSVAFSPDGNQILSGGAEGTLRRWDTETRRPIGMPLKGHVGPVTSVAFSPDGARIVSGGYDRTVRLWGEPLAPALDLLDCASAHGVTNTIQSLTDRMAGSVKDNTFPPLAPVAYHPSAWQRPDGLKQPPYGTVLYGREGRATAEVLAQWLDNQPSATKRAGQQAWKVEQAASLGNQRFVVNTCAKSPTEVPKPKADSTPVDQPPTKTRSLEGLRVAVSGCSVAELESKSIIKSILPAIERLGGKPKVQMLNEAQRTRFAPSDTGLNIHVTQKATREMAAAEALLAQPELQSGNWGQIFTRQESRNNLSIFVCPVDFSAQDSPRRSASNEPRPSNSSASTPDQSVSVADSSPQQNVEQKATELPPESLPPALSSTGEPLTNASGQQKLRGAAQSSGSDQVSSSNPAQQHASPRYQKRILWVDDQPENNRHEIAELVKLQIEVVTATSTEKALALLDSDARSFDLVISDWQRPELHLDTLSAGLHLLRQLQKRRPGLPIVFYHNTGEDQQRIARREEALREGAFGEAVLPDELLTLVTKALALKNVKS